VAAQCRLLPRHRPDAYYLIESSNPKVQGYAGGVMSLFGDLYAPGSNAH